MMPEVDGYQFLQNVRNSSSRNNNVPFIFLSALGQKNDIIKGVSLFANDYLLKPVDFEIMIAKVKEKAVNSLRIQELQQQEIDNLKQQVAVILPSDFTNRIAEIITIVDKLKEEPYGPVSHRLYLQDFSILGQRLKSLKAMIINSLDANVVEKRLNANEQVVSCFDLLNSIKNHLATNSSYLVELNNDNNSKNLPCLRIDLKMINEFFLAIANKIANHLENPVFSISSLLDHQNHLAIICYIKDSNYLPTKLLLEQILIASDLSNLVEKEGLYFAIGKTNQISQFQSFVIAIPSYRIVN
jgi:CheY-like chemotaxis protein